MMNISLNLLLKQITRKILSNFDWGYRYYFKRDNKITGPHGKPAAPWYNSVLTSNEQLQKAVEQVQDLGLPPVQANAKNWDTLGALDVILRNSNRKSRILDAGGEMYSMILPWLYLYGYKKLEAINLVFPQNKIRKGPIKYKYGDITATNSKENYYDGIACLSVIEHGVDIKAYFKEMARILKPGGLLITSADYFETPIDTQGLEAYGVPIYIFSKGAIEKALKIATNYGLELISPIDLRSKKKVVHWKPYDLNFTYIMFTLRKRNEPI